MPGNLFTPVTIRRRYAAQGCADAQPDRGPPEGGWVRVKPRLVSDMITGHGGLAGIDEVIK